MKTLQDWPRNEAFSFTIPISLMTISANEIRDTVLRIYREWRLKYAPTEYFPWGELAHGIDWKWRDEEGLSLPRRIAHKLYNKYKYKLSSKFWGELGNMLRERIPETSEVIIRITNQFDWKSGTFGDGGSCMWDGRAGTRKAMAESGKFLALQMFTKTQSYRDDETMVVTVNDRKYYSQARCWLYPTHVTIEGEDEYTVSLFNAYGGVPTSTMALIMQGLIGADGYKTISISNNGRTSGGVYVNGQSRLCGSDLALKVIHHLDFSFKNSYEGNQRQIRRGNGIAAASGAIINSPDFIRPVIQDIRKKKSFSAYRIQHDLRKQLIKQYHKADCNKYATKANKQTISDRWITLLSNDRFQDKPKSKESKPFKSQREYLKERLRRQYSYRGTTRAEVHMFEVNHSRLMNIVGWGPSLEPEFPRWNAQQRTRFKNEIASHRYNVWSYITHNLSQLIKEV